MRKLSFVSLCLDFVWVNAAVVLVDRLFPGIAETVLGQPASWAARQTLSLVLLAAMRGANASIGEWLLGYARTEQPGRRQWANLLLGTLGFASGIWYLLRLTEPGDATPFLFMVEDTPLKLAAVAIFSACYSWCGAMLLRFEPRAKFYNVLLFVSILPLTAINVIFSRDAMVATMVARAASQGQSFPVEKAEVYIRVSLYFTVLLVAIMLALLYFCRERPAAEKPLEGAQGGSA
ncbi:hypothetical protein DPM33_14995 [Mesorhizobium hawassense]|uniref:Uncharacterized protein n=1 Tax=Mesorhizobium hawassense TaxID=1209954 RepID=A0A330HTD1_9HYPH|nr:hypothetical protein [Mesorhizobium hawassense]RAZ90134.1 hypothetical protein DPM33_14995 [Mesorhizobium hawassense]